MPLTRRMATLPPRWAKLQLRKHQQGWAFGDFPEEGEASALHNIPRRTLSALEITGALGGPWSEQGAVGRLSCVSVC